MSRKPTKIEIKAQIEMLEAIANTSFVRKKQIDSKIKNTKNMNEAGKELNFEEQESGSFEFFKFEKDGDSFTGKFLAIIDEHHPENYGKFKINKSLTGILMVDYSDGSRKMISVYYSLLEYLKSEIAQGVDFGKCVYKFTRIKKDERKDGFVTFKIHKANIS